MLLESLCIYNYIYIIYNYIIYIYYIHQIITTWGYLPKTTKYMRNFTIHQLGRHLIFSQAFCGTAWVTIQYTGWLQVTTMIVMTNTNCIFTNFIFLSINITRGSPSSHVTSVSLVSVSISNRGSVPLGWVNKITDFNSSHREATFELIFSWPNVETSDVLCKNTKRQLYS